MTVRTQSIPSGGAASHPGNRAGEPRTVGGMLAAQRLVTADELRAAEEAADTRMVPVGDILREEGLVTDALLKEAVAEHFRIPSQGQLPLFPAGGMLSAFLPALRALREKRFIGGFLRIARRTEAQRARRLRALRVALRKRQRVSWWKQKQMERKAMREERKRRAQEQRQEREAARRRAHEERQAERKRNMEERERKRAEKRAASEAARKQHRENRQRKRDKKRLAGESKKRAKEAEKAARLKEVRRVKEEIQRQRDEQCKRREEEREERRRRKHQPAEREKTRAPLPITIEGIVTTRQIPTGAATAVAAPTVIRQIAPPKVGEQSAVAALRGEIESLKEENRSLQDALKGAGREHLPAGQAGTVVVEKETEPKGIAPEEERGMIAAGRAKLELERRALEEERAELRTERETFERERKPAAPAPAATEGEAPSAGGREALLREFREEYEEKLRMQKAAFDVERGELMRKAANTGTGIAGGADPARIREAAKEEAKRELERERTKWEIERGRIRQQAIAEAESTFLAKMKDGGLFGGKQKSALAEEIAQWKEKAERLEQERLALEQQRALHEEQVRMREQERQVEQEKLQIERERIAKEKEALASEGTHEEILEEERGKMEKEQEELEEAKKAREKQIKEARKTAKKAQREKRGFFGGKRKETEETDATAKPAADGAAAGGAPAEGKPGIDLGKILLAENYIDEKELGSAKAQAEERHVPLESVLREEGLVTKELMQNAIAEYYRMPFVDLGAQPPDTEVVETLPEEVATYLRAIAVEKKEDGSLVVATSDPSQGDMIKEEVKKALPDVPEVTLIYTSKDAIESALSFYRKALNTRFSRIIAEHKKIAPEILEEIFADAVQLGASDIHFEPQEKTVIVRFRVDGVMHEAGRLPKEYYEGVVNRVKIAGNMRIDEHFAAQDGAIRWKSGDRAMDVRVSIVPIVDGEKVVMRLLSEYVRTLTLRDLGFAARHLDTLVKMAHKPFGMILTTGPTGSGKSTTLYGLMKIRNSPDVNISTIEDPVEYKIPGINHIQVNSKANLTFERGLRALVRQDPDIILVGEIRDDITAQISVNAALTGHLLFSTLHANDAATAIPRLLEMGIEPYLLGSTLELVIAQRLMRRICTNCRYSYTISPAEAGQLFVNAERYFAEERETVTLYRGKGCGACGGTGYKGRVGVYELMPVTTEIEEAVVARRTSGDINNIARSQGMLTLFEDGLEKTLYGFSTIEELLRVAAPPDVLETSATPEVSPST